MFATTKAYSGFAVNDLAKAQEFYGGTLGLNTSERNGLLTLHLAGDLGHAGLPEAPDHTPATATPSSTSRWTISTRRWTDLTARGVQFLHHPGMDQDAKGINRRRRAAHRLVHRLGRHDPSGAPGRLPGQHAAARYLPDQPLASIDPRTELS